VGSFILGFLAGPIPRRTSLVLLLGIGFCGCLTTFSSWMLDVAKLIQAGRPAWGLLLIAVSLMLGLLCVAAGLALSRSLFSSPQD
jgi:CrcB protein